MSSLKERCRFCSFEPRAVHWAPACPPSHGRLTFVGQLDSSISTPCHGLVPYSTLDRTAVDALTADPTACEQRPGRLALAAAKASVPWTTNFRRWLARQPSGWRPLSSSGQRRYIATDPHTHMKCVRAILGAHAAHRLQGTAKCGFDSPHPLHSSQVLDRRSAHPRACPSRTPDEDQQMSQAASGSECTHGNSQRSRASYVAPGAVKDAVILHQTGD